MHKLLAIVVALATAIPAFPQSIPAPREASATQVNTGTDGSTYVSPRRLRGFIPSPADQSGKVLQSNGSIYILSAPPGGAWGTISGDIASQTDLSTALGLRVLSTTLATYFANPAAYGSFAPAAWRAALDLEPGVDYQPFNSNLNPFAANGSAYYLSRSNHSGTQSADTITDGTTNKAYTAAEQTKLASVESGAQVNRPIASQAEAEAGAANDKAMTPLRVAQAIAALAPTATGNVTNNGTLTDNYLVMGGGGSAVRPTTIQVTGGNNIVLGNITANTTNFGNITGATSDFELPWIGDQATGKFFKGNITVGPNMTRTKVGNNIVLDSISGGGGSLPGGMATLWTTADLGSLPADYIVSGSNGTDGPDTLGNRTVVVRSLGTVADPTVDIAPGAVPAGTVVTMNTTTTGAFFTATTNGTDPTYTVGTVGGNFTISANTTVEYRANKQGWVSSAVQSGTWTIDPIPTLSSAVLQASGTDIVIGWPESVSYGAGGTGGYALTASGGAVSVTGVTGGGTTSHTLTTNRTITNAESVTLDYTNPGNGAEDSAGQDVVTFTGFTVNTSGGPAGGGGFLPSDVSGLQAWYTGDDYDGTTATDLSSNARNATQATAGNRPSLQTAVLNGHDVMRFDGSDDYLDISSGMTVSSYTVFVVAKLTPQAIAQSIVSGNTAGSPDLGVNSSDYTNQEKNGVANILTGSTDTTNGNFRIYHYTYNGTTAYNYVDGVQDSTGSSSETFSAPINRMGRRFIPDQYVNGDVAEVIIYNAVLSGGDQTSVVGYLETKYGL